jgi:hypothetical protein
MNKKYLIFLIIAFLLFQITCVTLILYEIHNLTVIIDTLCFNANTIIEVPEPVDLPEPTTAKKKTAVFFSIAGCYLSYFYIVNYMIF